VLRFMLDVFPRPDQRHSGRHEHEGSAGNLTLSAGI
jgi:hypothetical protein